jgi:O-antigen ligase
VAWALLACFHSITPTRFALGSLAMTIGTILAGLVVLDNVRRLPETDLTRALDALALGLGLACAILLGFGIAGRAHFVLSERAGYLLMRMDRGATLAALLMWPALLGQWRRKRPRVCAALVLLALPAFSLSFALAAKVATILGALACALVYFAPRAGLRAIALAAVAVLLLLPTLAGQLPPPEETVRLPGLPPSVHHRMTIWSYAAGKIGEHPLIGWGFEASRSIAGKAEIFVTRPDGTVYEEALMPLHPHNAALQVWLEMGAVGAVLLAAFVALLALRLEATGDRLVRGFQAAGMVAGILIATVSFGFWQSWWQCSLWLGAAFLAAQGRRL